LDKIGDTCSAEKMQTGIKFSPMNTHPEYMRLASMGLLVVEQHGVISQGLVPIPSAASVVAATTTTTPTQQPKKELVVDEAAATEAVAATSAAQQKKYCRRNGQRSVACQVYFLAFALFSDWEEI
jgi:hypothetical protein